MPIPSKRYKREDKEDECHVAKRAKTEKGIDLYAANAFQGLIDHEPLFRGHEPLTAAAIDG